MQSSWRHKNCIWLGTKQKHPSHRVTQVLQSLEGLHRDCKQQTLAWECKVRSWRADHVNCSSIKNRRNDRRQDQQQWKDDSQRYEQYATRCARCYGTATNANSGGVGKIGQRRVTHGLATRPRRNAVYSGEVGLWVRWRVSRGYCLHIRYATIP